MTHRVETVLAKVTTLLDGLSTTGANVERGRFYPFEEGTAAALSIYQGQFLPTQEPNISFQDGELEVIVRAHAVDADNVVETVINQIANEVYVALLANRTLGLNFIHDTEWRGNDEPQLDTAQQSGIYMDMRFAVKLRHSYTDPSA